MWASGVVIPGIYHDPSVQAMASAINTAIGAYGKLALLVGDPNGPVIGSQLTGLKLLISDLNAGKVDLADYSERQSDLQRAR